MTFLHPKLWMQEAASLYLSQDDKMKNDVSGLEGLYRESNAQLRFSKGLFLKFYF
jgi:hypothetical protein